MGVGFVRFGGICAFLLLVAFIVLIGLAAANPQMVVQDRALMAIFLLIIYAMIAMVFLATKTLWNHFGRHGADIPIVFLVVIMVLFWVFNVIGAAGQTRMLAGSGSSAVGIIMLILILLSAVAWVWFAIYCIIAGNPVGGIWKATGILYVISILLGIVMIGVGAAFMTSLIMHELRAPGSAAQSMTQQNAAMGGVMGIVGFIMMLVMLAGWICQGVGLLTGAGKMQRSEYGRF